MPPSTIALRLEGEEISAPVLVKKIDAFLDLLREVDRSVTGETGGSGEDSRSVKWIVQSIHSGSPVTLTLRPEPLNDKAPASTGERIIASVVTGLATVESDAPMEHLPRHFSLPVLEDVRDLVRHEADGITGITVMTPDRTIALSSAANQNLHRFLAPAHKSHGSVEGTLQMVAAAGRRTRFSVRDRLSGRAIRCTVPRERQHEGLDAFDRPVIVEGRVSVNERGDVLSIHMERVTVLPDDSDLPDVEGVAGVFDLTLGKSVEEHLERLRDAS